MNDQRFTHYGGIVGNPVLPENEWSDAQMAALRDLGLNMLQLNLAWGNRPGGEVLNLEDLDDEHRAQFHYRISQAEKFGFRVVPHFGVPRMAQTAPPKVVASCILDDTVREKYKALLRDLITEFPSLRDVMIYTYDQDSWICDEFGDCPRCSGVPIYDRLPGFINDLKDELQTARPGTTLWWQPWEISAGQSYKIIERIEPGNFGVVINNALAETYFTNTADLWVDTVVRLCYERGIPVIGELQFTGCGVGCHSVQRLPCPKLVYDQIAAFAALDGVVGIREHFGVAVSKLSVNTSLFKEYVAAPSDSYERLVSRVAAAYGSVGDQLRKAWQKVSEGVKFIPYEATYAFSDITFFDPAHSWDAVEHRGRYWQTPAWESNRRAYYMVTRRTEIHPWLLEDVGLRLGLAADCLKEAAGIIGVALAQMSVEAPMREDVDAQYEDVLSVARSLRGTSLHYLETLAAYDLRAARTQCNGGKWLAGVERMRLLLEQDCQNRDNAEDARRQLAAFNADPQVWINTHMVNRFDYEQRNLTLVI